MAKSKQQNQGKRNKRNVADFKPEKKKSLSNKIISVITAVIVLGIVGLFCFMFFGKNYKSNAQEMKTNSILVTRLAGIMLADYQQNWLKVETEKVGVNAKGETVSTSNPQDVIKWRIQAFKDNGCMGVLDSLMSVINDNYGKMDVPPAKFKNVDVTLTDLYNNVTALSELAHNPGNSLVDLSKKTEQLMGEVSKNIEISNSDIDFLIDYNDINTIISQFDSSIKDKLVVEQMLKDHSTIKMTQADAIKYILQGFKALPDGNGVLYKEITKGNGPKALDNSKVKLHYEGKLMDGTVFDSSYESGEPVEMSPFQTVPGFWHALTNMQRGSKWQIYIPYTEAYGDRDQGKIKPYSNLEFTIEVFSITNNE